MAETVYRAVKMNDSEDIIAIGCDENQGGRDYNGVGVWCNFTFTEIPEASEEIMKLVGPEPRINLLKTDGESIMVKDINAIQAELAALPAMEEYNVEEATAE